MPLYIGDYIRDTRHLSTLEHGAYLLLIMDAWTHDGLLPSDPKRLARIAGLSPKEWASSGSTIMDLFTEHEDGFRHSRVDQELTKANRIIGQRSEAGKASAQARWGNEKVTGVITSVITEEVTNAPRNDAPSPSQSPREIPNGIMSDGDPTILPQDVVEVWNETAERLGLAKVRKLSPTRMRQLKARIREHPIEEWTEAIRAIERSPFLRGENGRGWRADFDFLLQPSSFQKLVEGSYDRSAH